MLDTGPALHRCSCIGLRAMVCVKVAYFSKILVELENSVKIAYKSHCQQTIISFERSISSSKHEYYQTCSILMLYETLYLHHIPLYGSNLVITSANWDWSRPAAIATKVCSYSMSRSRQVPVVLSLTIGVGAGKILGVRRIFAHMSTNLSENNS